MSINIDIFSILWYIRIDPLRSFLMCSFKKLAGLALASTTFLGVIAPLESRATPSPGEDWVYVTHVEPCVPKVSVSDNVVDNTIRIQVGEGNTCPISNRIFLFIQDNRSQPLKLSGIRASHNQWVVASQGVHPGQYRVKGINPIPGGIGDYNYIPAGELGIDQVITIGNAQAQASGQPHPVSPPPPVEVGTPQRVVTLDSESQRLLRNFDQWMSWFQVNIWPQLQPLIRAIESVKTS